MFSIHILLMHHQRKPNSSSGHYLHQVTDIYSPSSSLTDVGLQITKVKLGIFNRCASVCVRCVLVCICVSVKGHSKI